MLLRVLDQVSMSHGYTACRSTVYRATCRTVAGLGCRRSPKSLKDSQHPLGSLDCRIRWVSRWHRGNIAIQLAQVTFLALIRFDDCHHHSSRSEESYIRTYIAGTEVMSTFSLPTVALFWPLTMHPAESPPRASCRTTAIRVVVVRPRHPLELEIVPSPPITLLSRFDNAITTLSTLVTAPVAAHTTVELGYTNPGAWLPWYATLPPGSIVWQSPSSSRHRWTVFPSSHASLEVKTPFPHRGRPMHVCPGIG